MIWVWDGAHIIELILDHSLAAFPVLKDSKDRLVSLTKFFFGSHQCTKSCARRGWTPISVSTHLAELTNESFLLDVYFQVGTTQKVLHPVSG